MDLNARVDVNCGQKRWTDGWTENWRPISHFAKAGVTRTRPCRTFVLKYTKLQSIPPNVFVMRKKTLQALQNIS